MIIHPLLDKISAGEIEDMDLQHLSIDFQYILNQMENALGNSIPKNFKIPLSKSDIQKDDEGKLMWQLLPFDVLTTVVEVLTWAQTHDGKEPDGWKKIPNARMRCFGSVMRHIAEWKTGNTIDHKSQLPVLAHAICQLMFLMWHDANTQGEE